MKILVVSDGYGTGGAGIAAERITSGLQLAGCQVRVFSNKCDLSSSAFCTTINYPIGRILRRLKQKGIASRLATNHTVHQLRSCIKSVLPDCIMVHNLHSFQGNPVVFAEEIVRAGYPTVWVMHDMYPVTGRCANNYGCTKYLQLCDHQCPTPKEHPALEPTKIADAHRRKKALFQGTNLLYAVAPSKWLTQVAQSAGWKQERIRTIANPLPDEWFTPLDSEACKRALGVPNGIPTFLLAAAYLDDRRKGAHLAVEALESLNIPCSLLVMGSSTRPPNGSKMNIIPLGSLKSDHLKRMAYYASDCYLHPSLGDNLPNTVVESQACGRPVVAFPIGGLPEMIEHGLNGWIAESVSVSAFAKAIQAALSEMATCNHESIRLKAKDKYHRPGIIREYQMWMQEVLSSTSASPHRSAHALSSPAGHSTGGGLP